MKFSIKDFFGKCDQIRRKLWISSHLLKKSLMENFIFCAVKSHIHQSSFFLELKIELKAYAEPAYHCFIKKVDIFAAQSTGIIRFLGD